MIDKTITKQEYYVVLGLNTLASDHYKKANEFYEALVKFLDIEDEGHISDCIFGGYGTIDEALDKAGIKVEE